VTGWPPAPLLVDLYCGQGGASAGYAQAGFRVRGVDNTPQPLYPWTLTRADALDLLAFPPPDVTAWHASPPCTDHTTLQGWEHVKPHGTADLLARTIDALRAQPLPWVVENVVSRSTLAVMSSAQVACGRALGIPQLRRHRLFLASFPLVLPPCDCANGVRPALGVYGKLGNVRTRSGLRSVKATTAEARDMFETPWMSPKGLAQAIPAAYTREVGRQLLTHLSSPEAVR